LTDGDHINSISWSPDGTGIAGAVGFSADPTALRYITIWDTTTGQIIRDISFYPVELLSLDWSPDGSQIAGGGGDNNVTIGDVDTGAVVRTLTGHTGAILKVAWSPDGTKLASASSIDDRTIRVWNASTGQSLVVIPSGAFDFAWSPDNLCKQFRSARMYKPLPGVPMALN
jgi:WD40 repeat protein